MTPTHFYDFALTCEQLAATSKKLEKASILKEYFATLDDSDLALVARFLTGRPFALNDERVLNVGWAVVRDVVCELSGIDPEAFGALATRMGEAGAAAEIALQNQDVAPTLTIGEVQEAFQALGAARGPTRKRPLLAALLRRATSVEAKDIIKIMGGDLRIGLQEGQLEDAIARYAGVPIELVQQANMLLGDVGEVALLARRGRLAEARMRLFHPLKFMLASPIQSPEEIRRSIAGAFFVEDKYDGIRAHVHKAGDRLAIYSRTLDEITHRFPELHAPLLGLRGEFILDGEILAARDGRILPFKELQPRLGRKTVSPEVLAQAPAIFVAYDMLYQDAEVLLETPLAERRARLERLFNGQGSGIGDQGSGVVSPIPSAQSADDPLPPRNPLTSAQSADAQGSGIGGQGSGKTAQSAQSADDPLPPLPPLTSAPSADDRPLALSLQVRCDDVAEVDALFDAARARGNEGLIVKEPASGYRPGRRGREWLKVKKALATLDVVVTAVEVGHGKRRNVLSDYTFAVRASAEDGTPLNVGKAYSGLTDAEIAELTEWFKAHTIKDYGRVRLVEPSIVLEVAFDVVQPSARHKSGYALRFPRIVRIRHDKTAAEIDTLETVRRLAGEFT